MHHKWFHLKNDNYFKKWSKGVKNHQIHRADFGLKNSWNFGSAQQGCSLLAVGFEGAQACTIIVTFVWLVCGCELHKFVNLGESQCHGTTAPQVCTLCEHAELTYLVNSIKMGGSARWAVFLSGCGFT